MNQNVQTSLYRLKTKGDFFLGPHWFACSRLLLFPFVPGGGRTKTAKGGMEIVRKDALLTCLDADACCMCSCMYVCLSVYLSICLPVCMDACMHGCLHIFMCACMRVCISALMSFVYF